MSDVTAEEMLPTKNSSLVVRLHPVINMTNDQFFEFCQLNRDLRIERTASGDLVIMPQLGQGPVDVALN